jgi:predicted ATPase/class 3 adenylate cyclase
MGDQEAAFGGKTLPSGTVTFLFTDIEGSTRLAQQYPDRWEMLRERHHVILQSAMDAQSGYVFQIIGDAFCVAFHTVRDGLCAAIEAQRALIIENWEGTPVKVRMGIHTGSAELVGSDYRGYLTMAKVQRVMSVAYGGQVLLSNTSAELINNELPTGTTLRDMKEHRLKGLPDPERLWQIVATGLQQNFPRLQSLSEIPNNLPMQLSSFIGREKEVEQVKKRLEKNRLVTLTGSGGVGKTRLSIQIATEILEKYPNGAWLIELAPVTDPERVTQTVCNTLDVPLRGNEIALDVLIDYLKQKKILLVVDNCEHLIDACAQFSDSILHACPQVQILASSREALGIDGESAYRVPSLSVPDLHAGYRGIKETESVNLFMERANAVLPDFQMVEANALVVAQICRRLDGIPLAVELAASRVKILGVEQIAARLDDAFRLLTGGSRTALPRQQTLRGTIDWSYNLLSEEERTVLRCLSVFAGGWTLEAAEAVCKNSNMLDLLSHLVDKSLVVVDFEHGDEPRYSLLETIRQYAREKLSESDEANSIRDQHLAYFLTYAVRAEQELYGAEQGIWFDRLDVELDNFRTALEWSLDGGERGAELGLQMASSLWWFWFLQTRYHDEGRWLEKTLEASRNSTDLVMRANALVRLGWVRFFDEAHVDEGLALGRSLGPAGKESVALALLEKGSWAMYQADYTQAVKLAEESSKLFREIGNRWGLCEALTWIGLSLITQGNHELAITPLEESLALARQAKDGNEISFALWQLGKVALARGDYQQATSLMTESLALYRELKLSGGITFLLGDLGKAALGQGDYQQAASNYKEYLTIFWNQGNERYIAEGLEQLASVAITSQQPERAVRLFGAAEALRQSSGEALFPYQLEDYERNLGILRSHLTKETFTTCWDKGRAMSIKQAVDYALEEIHE